MLTRFLSVFFVLIVVDPYSDCEKLKRALIFFNHVDCLLGPMIPSCTTIVTSALKWYTCQPGRQQFENCLNSRLFAQFFSLEETSCSIVHLDLVPHTCYIANNVFKFLLSGVLFLLDISIRFKSGDSGDQSTPGFYFVPTGPLQS